jgi:hypothetical protein
MSEINTGGPAFPVLADVRPGIDKEWCGMTLRDYFAAKAMQGDMAGEAGGSIIGNAESLEEAAAAYYRIADAMLKARQV